jgi:Uma2 family endonuclease
MATLTDERLLTEEEFLALPDDPLGRKMELFDGRVVYVPQPGELHARIARVVFLALLPFVTAHRLGELFFDVGFKIRSAPDRIVSPDVSFTSHAKLVPGRDRTKAIPGAPTLAVEVVSPNDIDADVDGKVLEYLEAGAARVWVVRPASRTVTVHRPDHTARTYLPGETLASDDAGFPVDGFSLAVADVFADVEAQSRA